jgi:nitroreductase
VLTPDELLTTTRAVRRRLDLTRPVPRELLLECVEIALQAPAGSNEVLIEFVFVTDPALKARLGEIYREVYARYQASAGYIGKIARDTPEAQAQQQRSAASADAFSQNIGEVPVLAIGCLRGRPPQSSAAFTAGGAVMPAMWSFMLAARARGFGTAWTSMATAREREIAELLAIPYDEAAQFCLTPVAFTLGDRFSPARRPSAESVVHWDRW